ncbi:MAG: HAD family hydrolase [Phycisphaerae bacterium]
MSQAAVFLDRDDTLVVDLGFIDHPDKVMLVPGAVEAVRRLKSAGYSVVVATNQSGVARGYFDEERLQAIHARVQELLSAGGVRLDGIYYCPYLDGPEATVPRYRKASNLRKPAPGMLLKAARELDIDLSRSWMIGDEARDVEAGAAAGCRTILIDRNGSEPDGGAVQADHRTSCLLEAVMIVERHSEQDIDSREEQAGDADSEQLALLREIRDLLDRKERVSLHDDFSFFRLMATLVQMLALVVAGWGLYAMFTDQPAAALTRFALAGFAQLGMISFMLADRRR